MRHGWQNKIVPIVDYSIVIVACSVEQSTLNLARSYSLVQTFPWAVAVALAVPYCFVYKLSVSDQFQSRVYLLRQRATSV